MTEHVISVKEFYFTRLSTALCGQVITKPIENCCYRQVNIPTVSNKPQIGKSMFIYFLN